MEDFRAFAKEVRVRTGGIPIRFKLAASHIEADLDFAMEVGVDYVILDGGGGGTGSALTVLRDNINVPTIPALSRARKHLNDRGAKDVSLIITGSLRVAKDFAKAMMLGARCSGSCQFCPPVRQLVAWACEPSVPTIVR